MPQPQPHERVLVVGVTGSGKTTWTRRRVAGIPRCVVWAPKGDFRLAERCAGAVEAAQAAPDWRSSRIVRACVVPDFRADANEELEQLAEIVWWVGGLELVVEECGVLNVSKPLPHFARLIAMGRERGITVTCVGQRAVQVPPLHRSQVSAVISFRQTHPADVAALSEVIGGDAERVRALPNFHYLAWGPNGGAELRRIELKEKPPC